MARKVSALLLFIFLCCTGMNGTQIKTISSKEGISNNAILCIHQNDIGHLYIGTVDGLNIWNGHSMETFEASDGQNYFFGNQIKHIFPADKEHLILHTNYGLARLNMITRQVEFHQELIFSNKICVTEKGNVFSIDDKNSLQYFDIADRKIINVNDFKLKKSEICQRIAMSGNGKLCIFTDDDIYILTLDKTGDPYIRQVENLGIRCRHVSPKYDERGHYIITYDNKLCIFRDSDCGVEVQSDINMSEFCDNTVSGIIPADNGVYISFMQNGVFLLPHGQDVLESTDIDCGVFSMMPDRNQPIIWIGTDCNGLIRWSRSETDIVCMTYDKLPYSIKMPIRSIFRDKEGCLWLGTKGDGLYRLHSFSPDNSFTTENTDKFTTENSSLTHNSIYAIAGSRHNLIWIGSEGKGINQYSHKTGKLSLVRGSEHISMTHALIEHDDSTLYVATDGEGAYRCTFRMNSGNPEIIRSELINFSEPFNSETSLFSMHMQNDSVIWFGSRGQGILKYNTNSRNSTIISFPNNRGFAINETFFISETGHDNLLLATGNGLVTYDCHTSVTKTPEFVPKKATHSVLKDKNGNIWVSTNSGIIALDSTYQYRASFDRFSGLEVLEYSDGACFRDTVNSMIYFGGINGFTVINEDNRNLRHGLYKAPPTINLTNFIQNNEYSHVSLKTKNGKLRIPYSKSIFAIEFSVVDNLHYSDYKFSYKIDGYDSDWQVNNSHIIYMPSLSPGNYRLRVRYLNQATDYRSEECVLPIRIIPPFYLRWWAIVTYGLLIAFIIYKLVKYNREKYASMKSKIRKQYTDEVLRIKSETTSTITEELSVQITFILGLCNQIRQQTMNNPHVANKVNLVEYNIAKINKILHILNEYKGISETVANSGEITLIPVSQTVNEILELMNTSTHLRNVALTSNIEKDIIMAVNKEAFLTLFNSLINKMIAIAEGDKTIDISISRRDQGGIILNVTISAGMLISDDIRNTLENTDMENIPELKKNTDRLNEFEIILCGKLVKEMNGNIVHLYDAEKKLMSLTIELPNHIEDGHLKFEESHLSENINTYNMMVENQLPENFMVNSHLGYIYLVSNKKDISSFIGYFLSSTYNIMVFNDNATALEKIRNKIPLAIIYDISSMNDGFADFMDKMKENKRTCHIPAIALTSSLQFNEREECIKSGADLCLSFPFNIEYLRDALEKMLHKRQSIAEYYKSPISTYDLDEGKIIHQDDRLFMNKLLKIIDDKIADSGLTAAIVAKEMGTSTRVLYRRLENITDRKLHQIIKETRMKLAITLLTSSKLTIDEIMYRTGHDNRSTFYRNFKDSYGMTPKEYRDQVRRNILKSISANE